MTLAFDRMADPQAVNRAPAVICDETVHARTALRRLVISHWLLVGSTILCALIVETTARVPSIASTTQGALAAVTAGTARILALVARPTLRFTPTAAVHLGWISIGLIAELTLLILRTPGATAAAFGYACLTVAMLTDHRQRFTRVIRVTDTAPTRIR